MPRAYIHVVPYTLSAKSMCRLDTAGTRALIARKH
jgi:hypothetical protein